MWVWVLVGMGMGMTTDTPGYTHADAYTCIAVGFYCATRLGEFMVPNLHEKFDSEKYIT